MPPSLCRRRPAAITVPITLTLSSHFLGVWAPFTPRRGSPSQGRLAAKMKTISLGARLSRASQPPRHLTTHQGSIPPAPVTRGSCQVTGGHPCHPEPAGTLQISPCHPVLSVPLLPQGHAVASCFLPPAPNAALCTCPLLLGSGSNLLFSSGLAPLGWLRHPHWLNFYRYK